MSENSDDNLTGPAMHHREITLADGRYMIFYTFGDETEGEAEGEQEEDV